MKRRFSGLHQAAQPAEVPDGIYLLLDFGYHAELLGRDELDTRAIVIQGVVKIRHKVVNGASLLNLDGFAPSARWEALSGSGATASSEVA